MRSGILHHQSETSKIRQIRIENKTIEPYTDAIMADWEKEQSVNISQILKRELDQDETLKNIAMVKLFGDNKKQSKKKS